MLKIGACTLLLCPTVKELAPQTLGEAPGSEKQPGNFALLLRSTGTGRSGQPLFPMPFPDHFPAWGRGRKRGQLQDKCLYIAPSHGTIFQVFLLLGTNACVRPQKGAIEMSSSIRDILGKEEKLFHEEEKIFHI